MKKLSLLLVISAWIHTTLQAQTDNGIMRLDEFRYPKSRNIINIPNVNGLQVLKCDFHMHTVFTDGHVWPNVRVQEAWKEGLDAISLTEHIEYTPHKDDVKPNNLRSYELAKNLAAENNLLLIKGTEVTRNTPPGHFNALFIHDNQDFVIDRDNNLDPKAIEAVVKQNAFIFWNHPGWKATSIAGSYDWLPFIEKMYQDKNLHGIEVVNGFGFYKKALDWALDRNLTILGNTDMHNLIAHDYDIERGGVHRTMTLVLAKDRTAEAIREALQNQKTIAWSSKYLFGSEENIKALFYACVSVSPSYYSKKATNKSITKYYEITNNSDLYFELKLKEGSGTKNITLYPQSSQILTAPADQKRLTYEVVSTYVRSNRHLNIEIAL